MYSNLVKCPHSLDHSNNMSNHVSSHDPSPWEMNAHHQQQPVVKESSPWEMAPQQRCSNTRYETEDDSPAGAYGAYSVRPKRRQQANRDYVYNNEAPPAQPHSHSHQQSTSKQHSSAATQSTSPAPVRKQTPYKTSNAFKSSPSLSSVSSSSSRKSTPNRARPKDAASRDETSSLLNNKDSDDDDMTADKVKTSPDQLKGIYKLKENEDVSEVTSSLTHDDTDSNCGDGQIDLEWDPTLMTDSSVQSETVPVKKDESQRKKPKKKSPSDKLAKVLASLDDVTDKKSKHNPADAPDNLLLSYNELDQANQPKSNIDILQGLFDANQIADGSGKEDVDRLQELLPSPKRQHTSDDVAKDPLLESFFESPPPPPQEFASSREKVLIPTPVHSSNDSTPSHVSAAVSQSATSMSYSDDSAMASSSYPSQEDDVSQGGIVEEMKSGDDLMNEQCTFTTGRQESDDVVVVDTDELTNLKPTTNNHDFNQPENECVDVSRKFSTHLALYYTDDIICVTSRFYSFLTSVS